MHKPDSDIAQTLGLDQGGRRRRFGKWGWPVGGIAAIAIIVVVMRWPDNSDSLHYQTEPVVRSELTVTVSATGTLQPLNEVEVGSELSGTIVAIDVDFNDTVESNQVLARLDTTALENRIAEGRASLQQAEARVEEAKATKREMQLKLARCRELAKKQMCSANDLDAAEAADVRARAAVANTSAQVAMAKAVLEGYETNLTKAFIRSPINGVVLDRKVEPGQTVAASLQTPELFTLAEDLKRMELIVAIDEADIGRIRNGLNAVFKVDAYPDRSFKATIKQIRRAPQTVDGVVTYKAVLGVDNRDEVLLPGMTATADIVVNSVSDALLVPNAALRFMPPSQAKSSASGRGVMGSLIPRPPASGGKPRPELMAGKQRKVWVLRENTPVAVEILTGDTDGSMTEVLQGEVEPGTPLLVDIRDEGA